MTSRHVLIGALVLAGVLAESHIAVAQGRGGGRSFGSRPQGPLSRSRGNKNLNNNENSNRNANSATEKDATQLPIPDSQRSAMSKLAADGKQSGGLNQSSQSIDTKDTALKIAMPKPAM